MDNIPRISRRTAATATSGAERKRDVCLIPVIISERIILTKFTIVCRREKKFYDCQGDMTKVLIRDMGMEMMI